MELFASAVSRPIESPLAVICCIAAAAAAADDDNTLRIPTIAEISRSSVGPVSRTLCLRACVYIAFFKALFLRLFRGFIG